MKIVAKICGIFILSITTLLIVTHKRRKRKRKLREAILSDNSKDYNETARNIALSIGKSKALYKKLITQVHPDNFIDNRNTKATELSQRITSAKRSYSDLLLLEKEVNDFLQNAH
jgi:hypothetical protein